ncbi:hypothetical protein JYG23_04660 [Sedimentibacter sp. zth1]|uniref:hypothetical protein n=1 Tax=Sedimentibacter sp. zth1 TaxID=2816908 RepID=UPI001A91C67D|nr:hypothetical protein [Sedimentibacter sp. zth1]QSX06741.1 hypothetical protein JYG23_04660 [Sedimentibacter sp. zth1]
MIDKILEILNKVCASENEICKDTELLDSGILDSYAIIQFIYELELLDIELQLTQISKRDLRNPIAICNLINRK